jgi:hypothetical protein
VVPSKKKAAVAASSRPAKSKAVKNSGALVNDDNDRTGIESTMKAAAAAAMSGPAKRKAAAVNNVDAATTPLKKTKAKIKPTLPKAKTRINVVKKPGIQSDDQHFWNRFSEMCQYKADHGTMRVPRTNAGTNNILANWVHYTRKRYVKNLLPVKYVRSKSPEKDLMPGLPNSWTSRTHMALSYFWAIIGRISPSWHIGISMPEKPSKCRPTRAKILCSPYLDARCVLTSVLYLVSFIYMDQTKSNLQKKVMKSIIMVVV